MRQPPFSHFLVNRHVWWLKSLGVVNLDLPSGAEAIDSFLAVASEGIE